MASLQAAMRALVTTNGAPASLCRELNGFVCDRGVTSRFITFFTCRIDTTRTQLTYCNAGHNPPILCHGDGTWQLLSRGGMVLGIKGGAAYEQGAVSLSPGDVLVLYTDGLTEACDRQGREFGDQRLVEILVSHRGESARMLQERLIDEVVRFNHGGLADDVTLVVASVDPLHRS